MRYEKYSRDNLEVVVGQRVVTRGVEYKIQGRVGDGAIGVVRKALNVATGNIVAIKFLAPELRYIEENSLDDIYSRFRREGRRGILLDHSNLIQIIAYEDNENGSSFIEDNGPHNPFIVMEYVKGRTLENHIKKYANNKPEFNINPQTLYLAKCITQGLVFLHEKKLVHRDVKPANIYLSKAGRGQRPNIVQLGDFGVVKWGDFKASMATGTLTMSGQKGLGTWKYMSPEQATKPKDISVRSDMFSLGITLFELFTGQIFPTPHHIFQLTRQRLQRKGNTISRLHELGLGILPPRFELLFNALYDMMLTSPQGRPSSIHTFGIINGILQREQERLIRMNDHSS